MALQFWFHPLASFCHKVLIALYEKDISFEPVIVDFGDPDSVAAFKKVWPMAKMPVLVDQDRGETIAETTIILEYLELHCGGPKFLPADLDDALKARFWDRFYDHYVEVPMQKIVTDNLRPEGHNDSFGVEQARVQLREAYGVIDMALAGKTWAMGDTFGIADCAAAPGLFYANTVEPIGATFPNAAAYARRLMMRPSYARILRDAEPYFVNFPMPIKPDISAIT
ncbi:MAG: glutathione S-transferase family protein [Rhizobiaceae bacterium]